MLRMLAVTTSYPLREGDHSGVFVQRLYEAFGPGWRIDVACPADCVHSRQEIDPGRSVHVRPFRYAPRQWRVLAQGAGGVMAGVRARPWRLLLVPGFLVAMAWATLRLARQSTLIHANWAICGAIAAVVGLLTRRPVVTTLRGDDVSRAISSLPDRCLLWLAVRGSAAVICVSEAMAEELRLRYPWRACRIHACLNGVDPRFQEMATTGPTDVDLRLVAIGSLIPRKGLDVVLKALAQCEHRELIRLCVVGDGPEGSRLRTLAGKLGVGARVQFKGHVAPDVVPALLADADALVLASRSEGRPNVVIEAVAAARPVISSDLPGVRGLVRPGVNGDVFQVGNAEALASILDALAAKPGLRGRWKQGAREVAATRTCTWEDTARCYQSVFSRVLQTSGQA